MIHHIEPIKKLPQKTYVKSNSNEGEDICIICLEELQENC